MITARTIVDLGTIEVIEKELSELIEEFDRAVNVEALRRTKATGKHLFLVMVYSQLVCAEQEHLLGRLGPVLTNYHLNFGCMDGTRESLLRQLMDWVTSEPGQSNTYWIYGLPGIGKTSLAHSICARLHEGRNLAGAFFCRRDDASLSEPRNILPTLLHKLAGTFPPFRNVVVEHLRNDPHWMPGSIHHSLLELIRQLPRPPKRTLVFVIDAIDECGNGLTGSGILKALTDAAAHAPWLKLIITSRPEVDIRRLFDALDRSSHERYELAVDNETSSDLRLFAQIRLGRVASARYLPSSWPDPWLFDQVISKAAGLFIFIETIARALEHCEDHPTEHLKAMLEDSAHSGLTSLYGLYSSILSARIVYSTAEFRRVIGVLLSASPYRPLYEETIAELAGVRLDLVKMWVANLSSLLYQDEGANGGIRVRHMSVSDFFLSDDCHSQYHVDIQDANMELGIACMKKMLEQLRFNICKLEDSRLANAEIDDLPSRIKENISDALQYSCLYWSNHLCFNGKSGDERVWESLRIFFEGPYGLFWVELLSIMGMVRIGVSSLRSVITRVVKVSTAPTLQWFANLIWCRILIYDLLRGLRIYVVSSTHSALRSL